MILEENKLKKCTHSFVDAKGVNGGAVFKYCNICGMTKHGIHKMKILYSLYKKEKVNAIK